MPNPALDEIDLRILDALQRDARLTVEQLGRQVGLSASPTARRVRQLEKDGVIRGYVALLDQARIGLPISVFASIKLERQREEELDRFAAAVSRSAQNRRVSPLRAAARWNA